MGLATFNAFATDNDAGAITIGAKHPAVNIESALFLDHVLRHIGDGLTAGHTKTAFLGYDVAAGRAFLSGDLLITVGTFHFYT